MLSAIWVRYGTSTASGISTVPGAAPQGPHLAIRYAGKHEHLLSAQLLRYLFGDALGKIAVGPQGQMIAVHLGGTDGQQRGNAFLNGRRGRFLIEFTQQHGTLILS